MQNSWKKTAIGVGGAGALALSGAALSSAQGSGTQQPSAQSTQGAQQPSGGGHGHKRGTPVDATTLASLKKAVAAKDSGVTVEHAMKEQDGTFHAMGTKAGKRVHIEASTDMKTVTVRQSGPGGPGGPDGHGGHGPHQRGTELSGSQLTNVKTAVKAKDSGVTVEKAFKGPDGGYHAMGTKAGKRVMVTVSKDLKTVTVMAGGIGHGGPRGGHGPGDWKGAGQQGANSAPQGSATQGSTSNSSTQIAPADAAAQAA